MVDTAGPHRQPSPGSPAAQLLGALRSSVPSPDEFIPGYGMPGGADIPEPHSLIAPAVIGGTWPEGSDSQWDAIVGEIRSAARRHEETNRSASAKTARTLDDHWPKGRGSQGARDFHSRQTSKHERVADLLYAVADEGEILGTDRRRAKRQIREAHDEAVQAVDKYLRTHSGTGPINIGIIIAPYRMRAMDASTELHTYHTQAAGRITARFGAPESPASTSGEKETDRHQEESNQSTKTRDGLPDKGVTSDGETTTPVSSDSRHQSASTPLPPGLSWTGASEDRLPGISLPKTGTRGAASGLSALGSVSGAASGGGSGGSAATSPFSGLGVMSGVGGGGLPGGPSSATFNPGGLQSTPPASIPSLATEFGRGMAAGATSAGIAPPITPVAGPAPQVPPAPLAAAAPLDTTAPAAAAAPNAAAAAPVSAPHPTPTAAPAPGSPSMVGGGGMVPYSGVLPPSPPATPTPSTGGAPPAPSMPATGGGAGMSGIPPVMPVVNRNDRGRTEHDSTEQDMEIAQRAVAELAGATSVNDYTEWAVCVSRPHGGLPILWVATNEGACYIPGGVHLEHSMLPAVGDEVFNDRWLGWANPAEKAVRAAWARGERGDVVSCVATTSGSRSQFLDEEGVDCELGVRYAPGSGGPASELSRRRLHRLQTVDHRLYDDLIAADKSAIDAYCRQLTSGAAFGGTDDLSPQAQAVARKLVAQQQPTDAEWRELHTEYSLATLTAGAMRPGLDGIEDAAQTDSYRTAFIRCRRLETLICWHALDPDHADIVYAAWIAGVRAPLQELVA
jgi:hypothetical protein